MSHIVLEEYEIKPDPVFEYDGSVCSDSAPPIVIDNGAYNCRVGYATDDEPKLIFRNLITKLRGKKDPEIYVGNDIQNLEAMKWLLRSPFEVDVVTQFDVQETVFDHIFHHLGMAEFTEISHPIVITEAAAVPLWSRSNMFELLFECYQVPSVLTGIDALFSHYHNRPQEETGLVIAMGHHSCRVLPLVNGKIDIQHSTRLNLGGFNFTLYLQRLMQLKYPKQAAKFTFTKCEHFVHHHCNFATNFKEEAVLWSSDEYYEKNVTRINLAREGSASGNVPAPLPDTFTVKTQRLFAKVEANLVKKREMTLAEYEEQRKQYKALQDIAEDEEITDPALLNKAYQRLGVKNATDLRNKLAELNQEIRILKILLDPKQDLPVNVMDDLREWLKENVNVDEAEFVVYAKELRSSKADEDVWLLNELIRESEVEGKISKRYGVSADVAEVGPEVIRVPELFFSPRGLINFDQCGLAEAIENAVKSLPDLNITENIFVTGGCARLPGLKERIIAEATMARPFQAPLSVTMSENPLLDAWYGARKASHTFKDFFVSKSEYKELGSEYVKEHRASNLYTA